MLPHPHMLLMPSAQHHVSTIAVSSETATVSVVVPTFQLKGYICIHWVLVTILANYEETNTDACTVVAAPVLEKKKDLVFSCHCCPARVHLGT